MLDVSAASRETQEPVTLLISSTNVRDPIELCLKSVFKHTRAPFRVIVLDSGDDYTDIPFLEALHRRGTIRLLKENEGLVPHDQALNTMLELVDTEYFATLDSDVEILKNGWLSLMLRAIEHEDADLVCAREFHVGSEIADDREYCAPDDTKFTLWMTLYRTRSVRSMAAPFTYREKIADRTPAGRTRIICYDTGMELFHALKKKGTVRELPDIGSHFTHYGSMAILINRVGCFSYYFGGVRNLRRRVAKYRDFRVLVSRNRLYYGSALGMRCWNVLRCFRAVRRRFK